MGLTVPRSRAIPRAQHHFVPTLKRVAGSEPVDRTAVVVTHESRCTKPDPPQPYCSPNELPEAIHHYRFSPLASSLMGPTPVPVRNSTQCLDSGVPIGFPWLGPTAV